jgi:hydrogenase 3 maturation protease
MSLNSWQASIQRLLSRPTVDTRIAVVGIGNTFRSDDAAGVLVARALMESRVLHGVDTVLVIDAGHAPENGTGQLRRFETELVLLIDAAEMGDQPGTVRLIEMDEIEGISASTHSLPLSMLAKYLALELNCQIALLGIQPESTAVGEGVSCSVRSAAGEIVITLEHALTASKADHRLAPIL